MTMYLRHILPVLAALILTLLAGRAAAEAPDVVVTIKPLHALVAGVMDGVGRPTLLISGGATPHHLAMRPSQARAVNNASVLFWVGAAMEAFLEKTVAGLGAGVRIVTVGRLPDLRRLPVREGGAWAAPAGEIADDHPGHVDDGYDPHIWLDPRNAKVVVSAVSEALGAVDPNNAAVYAANRTAMHRRLDRLEAEIHARLGTVKSMPYIVFHDAYQYFERRFGTNAVGSIATYEAARPGARRLHDMRKKILASGAVCLFTEPQFEPALVATLIEGTATRTGTLDPVGADLKPGVGAYSTLLRAIAANLDDCLSPQS